MPELPEVETTRRGITPALQGRHFTGAVVRESRLRWPVPAELNERLAGQAVEAVNRRAKYLLIQLAEGGLILHLGMSGRLRVLPADSPLHKHDHVDLCLDDGQVLRLNDPRRFGAVLWQPGDALEHPLLAALGPEPLSAAFDGDWLHARARGLSLACKNFIMNQRVVVGVGNIYASEALYRAGIHPRRPAGRISAARYRRLATAIREVLEAAIARGGTTLRDYVGADGAPGYFKLALDVYERGGLPCPRCAAPIRRELIGQRASYYCGSCQR